MHVLNVINLGNVNVNKLVSTANLNIFFTEFTPCGTPTVTGILPKFL